MFSGKAREAAPRLYSRPIEGPRKITGNTLSMCRDLPKSAISSSRASTAGLCPQEFGGRVTQNQELLGHGQLYAIRQLQHVHRFVLRGHSIFKRSYCLRLSDSPVVELVCDPETGRRRLTRISASRYPIFRALFA